MTQYNARMILNRYFGKSMDNEGYTLEGIEKAYREGRLIKVCAEKLAIKVCEFDDGSHTKCLCQKHPTRPDTAKTAWISRVHTPLVKNEMVADYVASN